MNDHSHHMINAYRLFVSLNTVQCLVVMNEEDGLVSDTNEAAHHDVTMSKLISCDTTRICHK